MAKEYEVTVEASLCDLFNQSFTIYMESQNFSGILSISSMGGLKVTEFRREEDIVTLETSDEVRNHRRLRVTSQTLEIDAMVGAATKSTVACLLAEYWEPYTNYGPKRFHEELTRAINRVWTSLPGKKKGV